MLLSKRDWVCAVAAAVAATAVCLAVAYVLRNHVAEYAEFDLSTFPHRVETAVGESNFDEAKRLCRTALSIDHGNAHAHLLYVYTLMAADDEKPVAHALELARFNADLRIKEGHYTEDILRLVDAFENMATGDWGDALTLFQSLDGTKWADMEFVRATKQKAAGHTG
jgi:hypothetical protein